MSVQSQIDRINENVANTYSVLEGFGAEMPQTRNTANLPETAADIKAVLYNAQNLAEEQKAQARENIGVPEPFAAFTSNTTPAQVFEAINAGKNVALIHTDDTFGLLVFTGFLYVQSVNAGVSSGIWDFEGTPMRFSLLGDVGTGKWNFTYSVLADIEDIPEIPGALPNPNALTFTGGVSKSYDGSSAVSVEIPKLNYNPMTPQVYGAKGDGTTDDTAAFQNALANNRTVFVPGGTYKLSGELVIRDNCQMELAQDVVLNFTNTSGNCITMNRSAFLKGNHATVFVPYAFTGRVINVDTSVHTNTKDVPPFTHWDPQWKTARYLTDLNICKANSYGLHESLSGESNGTAVYVYANGSATSTFIWGMNFSGLRIAGAFEYGLRAISTGYNHEMRVEAFMDAVKIGVSLEDCNNAYISATVQPRKANNGTTYATHGIQLIRCQNTDLSGSRVWDWNAENSLWSYDKGNVNQHIAMYGDCMGTILNDYNYHYLPSGFDDLRELIHTDTPANFDSLIILQEPFTRWFRQVDNQPYFNDGDTNQRLLLKNEFDALIQADMVPQFTNVLATASDGAGGVFNGIGYKTGVGLDPDGKTFFTSDWHFCTGYIPCKQGDVLHVRGMSFSVGNDNCRVVLYDANFNKLTHVNRGNIINGSYYVGYTETENGFDMQIKEPANVAYITITAYISTLFKNPAISVNEDMVYRQEGFLSDGIKVKAENVIGAIGGSGINVSGATPGQTIRVKTVDENGTPTAWEAVDMPYTKPEIDAIMGSYITDIDTLLGGDG